ncbi:MAG: hypothetical protein AAF485_06765, partial [Chloroflexota bacterium]
PVINDETSAVATQSETHRIETDGSHNSVKNGTNGNGTNGNGYHSSQTELGLAETPALYQPVETHLAPPEPEPLLEVGTGQSWLHITIPRSGDLLRDKHRMKVVYDLLAQQSGDDHFVFYIPRGNKKVRVDFPNESTQNSAHLMQRLTEILGATAVRVETSP